MKVNIKIYFDNDEKRLLQKFPNYVTDDAVKIATQRGLEVINGYMGDKGGGVC